MYLIKIIYFDGTAHWYRSSVANPDDALTDLYLRGLYNFAAGDRVAKVLHTDALS